MKQTSKTSATLRLRERFFSINNLTFIFLIQLPVPPPGCIYDLPDIRVGRLPLQDRHRPGRIRYEHGRVPRPSPLLHDGDLFPGDLPRSVYDLAHRKSFAVAEIEGIRLPASAKVLQGRDMGAGKVRHMDVIPDAGAVRGFVIGPEYGDVLPHAQGRVKDKGDQVRFRLMPFPHVAIRVRTGCVEIPERHVTEVIGAGIIRQDLLYHELAPAVGIDGLLRVVFRYGDFDRVAENRGSGRKNEPVDAVLPHHLEEIDGVLHIVDVIFLGILHRFSHVGEGAEVHDRRYAAPGKNRAETLDIAEIAPVKLSPPGEFPVTGAQVVDNDGPVALFVEHLVHLRAYVSGPACDEDMRCIIDCHFQQENNT